MCKIPFFILQEVAVVLRKLVRFHVAEAKKTNLSGSVRKRKIVDMLLKTIY